MELGVVRRAASGMGALVAITVRPVRPEDRQDVAAILTSSGGFSDEEVHAGLMVFDEAAAGGYSAFCAEVDGAARAYVCVAPISLTASTWHLYWIGVHGGFQARGLGQMVLQYAEEFVRGAAGERITLETSGRAGYTRARRFYEASGYLAAGRIRDFYRQGDDCVIYCKELR
jgi:ribosomal protein S18 acetylase RimI-like enzyme